MPIQLLKENDQVDVLDSELVDGGDKDVVYTIRKITPELRRDFIKRHTRPGNHRRLESVNWEAVNDDQLDYLLVAWRGVMNGKEPAECSRANKNGGLDPIRKSALIDRAGVAELVAAEDAKADSFR